VRLAEVNSKRPVAGITGAAGRLQKGDIIITFDGKKVASFSTLHELLGNKKPDDKVVVEVRRGKQTLKLQVTLGSRSGLLGD
jgi:S1-C subfamily serine protease